MIAMSLLTFSLPIANAKPKKIVKQSREQHGFASWYGKNLNGKKTASGEKLDSNELTVAHRFLPFNSIVRITNKKNGKSVLARVNDRGPFVKNRIIDLTRRTANAIDMESITPVKVEAISDPLEIAQYRKR